MQFTLCKHSALAVLRSLRAATSSTVHTKQYAKSEEQFLNLIHFYPESYYGYVGLLEIYYEQKLWDELYNLINNLAAAKRVHILPRKYQLFVRQFGGTHIEKGD